MNEQRIPCPHCGELILPDAKKCQYCKSFLAEVKKPQRKIFGRVVLFGLAGLGILFISCVVFLVYIMTNVDNKYTGEELFAAVNAHRKSVGVQELQLDINLCDNLVDRWKTIREGDAHRSFEDWASKEGLMEGGLAKNFNLLGEMYVTATTPDNAIAWWVGSPGHKLTLEKPELNVGCAYASDGTGVVIVAETK